ncbi:MAG: IS200/IS605 family transposase [Patescibacteria group bacterium]|nr:IS200/IS605 family transposase [Patescibacteria group bacterium]
MRLLKQAHTVYQTQYHIVWVTRYRRKILVKGIDSYLKTLITKEFREFFPDIYVEEVGIDKDHIHIHCVIPPKYAVSKIVEAWKSNTSRLMKEKFHEFLMRVYWDGEGIWGTGFFVSTIGLNEKIIKAYVAQQGKHDAGRTAKLFV